MTIALAMIVRDEEASLPRLLASVRQHIDYWVIVDTGSVDNTIEFIHGALGAIPGELHEQEWANFGHNRSELLKLARGKADYLLLPDADDELIIDGELPELTHDCYNIRYDAGNMEWYFPRLIRSSKPWYYVGPAHAYLDCDESFTQDKLPNWSFVHHGGGKDRTEKFHRDISLFSKAIDENPRDSRSWFYLAQSFKDTEQTQLAALCYEKRASMGGWEEESFYAAYMVGVLRRDKSKLFEAFMKRTSRAEPLFWLARLAREEGDLEAAIKWATKGLEIPYPTDRLFVHKWIYEVGLAEELKLANEEPVIEMPSDSFQVGERKEIEGARAIWQVVLDGA